MCHRHTPILKANGEEDVTDDLTQSMCWRMIFSWKKPLKSEFLKTNLKKQRDISIPFLVESYVI